MEKTKKVSKLELEILELERKLAPLDSIAQGGKGGDGGPGNLKVSSTCVDEYCVPRPEGAEC